jgi:hypothetical protein
MEQIVKLLMIENQRNGDDFIEAPSWEDIEAALHKIDGCHVTYLGFYKEEEPTEEDFLMVGGGIDGKHYVCCYYNKGDDHYVLNLHEKEPDKIVDVPIGQMGAKKKKYCNDLKDIIAPVKYFYETGNMSPDVIWEIPVFKR